MVAGAGVSSRERTGCSLWRPGRFPGGSDPKQRPRIRAAQRMGSWGERWRERGTEEEREQRVRTRGLDRGINTDAWRTQNGEHWGLLSLPRTPAWPGSFPALSAGSPRVHRGSTGRDLGRGEAGSRSCRHVTGPTLLKCPVASAVPWAWRCFIGGAAGDAQPRGWA